MRGITTILHIQVVFVQAKLVHPISCPDTSLKLGKLRGQENLFRTAESPFPNCSLTGRDVGGLKRKWGWVLPQFQVYQQKHIRILQNSLSRLLCLFCSGKLWCSFVYAAANNFYLSKRERQQSRVGSTETWSEQEKHVKGGHPTLAGESLNDWRPTGFNLINLHGDVGKFWSGTWDQCDSVQFPTNPRKIRPSLPLHKQPGKLDVPSI